VLGSGVEADAIDGAREAVTLVEIDQVLDVEPLLPYDSNDLITFGLSSREGRCRPARPEAEIPTRSLLG